MTLRLSIGLVAALAALSWAAPADAGGCARAGNRPCATPDPTVDFTLVPDITKQIVMHEPAAPPPQAAPAQDGKSPYTGPAVGVSKAERVPTIGYRWSLN